MRREQIQKELEALGMALSGNLSGTIMRAKKDGLNITLELNQTSLKIDILAEYSTRIDAKTVKSIIQTLRSKLADQLYTLDEMIAKYDEVKE